MTIPITGQLSTTSPSDTYATHDAATGLDGLRSVADNTARNAIPSARRRQGMLVFTQDSGKYWQLNASPWLLDSTDWTEFNSGSGSLAIGNSVGSGNTNRVLFEDGSTHLADSANLTWDGSLLTINGKLHYKSKYATVFTDTDAATITIDLDQGDIHKVVLGGNRTITATNLNVGSLFQLILQQDGTGSRTVTWTIPNLIWTSGTPPVLSTTPGTRDLFHFEKIDSSTVLGILMSSGPQGSVGAQGFQGGVGAQGFQGSQGGVGAQGAQGFQGGAGASSSPGGSSGDIQINSSGSFAGGGPTYGTGTLVLHADGTNPPEQIKSGSTVLAFHDKYGNVCVGPTAWAGVDPGATTGGVSISQSNAVIWVTSSAVSGDHYSALYLTNGVPNVGAYAGFTRNTSTSSTLPNEMIIENLNHSIIISTVYVGGAYVSGIKLDSSNNTTFGGAMILATLADSAAPNGSQFIGSDHSNKLCFKDGSGVVHPLY